MFNFKYFKIAFAKGLTTKEIILEYVEYLKGLQDNDEVLTYNELIIRYLNLSPSSV